MPARPELSRRHCLLAFLLALLATVARADGPQLVIIIDDVGNNREQGLRAVSLPGKLNLAVLPGTPNAAELAELGSLNGKEILLHVPMSNRQQHALGPAALTPDMTERQLRETLALSIDTTPYVRGVSNHMGSELTSMEAPMRWLMEELADRGLYFVDSRTTVDTLAADTAERLGIPHLSRRVFLDNEATPDAIERQFKLLLQWADREGVAVAIGHPYPETLDFLQKVLPTLEAGGYRLALVSEVLRDRQRAAR